MEWLFHMLTIKQVLECVRQSNWVVSVDLYDEYFSYTDRKQRHEVPAFFLPVSSISIQPPSLWILVRLMHILEMCRDSTAAPAHSMDENPFLSA